MNQQQAIIHKFHTVLPAVCEWIDETIEKHEPQAVLVGSLGFRRLPQHYSQDLLDNTKVVIVPRVPFPPLRQLGLQELAEMEQMPFAGITYKDTLFLHQSHLSESLYFHEMVHIVQWERLGVANFLLAYGVGLVQFGYEKSPLEQTAYVLQENFERAVVPPDVIHVIHERTDAIWSQVAPLVQRSDDEN